MPLLRPRDAEKVREILADRLEGEVKITCFTQGESVLFIPGHECETCKSTRELMEEVTALAPDKLRLEIKDFLRDKAAAQEMGIERIPALVLEGAAKGKVRFYGLPAGYEFSTLIESLANVSTGEPEVDEATKQAVAGITQDLHIQVFTTPT
jgi:alkyl hydroperoxide reductase subunit AhpF